jgi:hypothetical protein
MTTGYVIKKLFDPKCDYFYDFSLHKVNPYFKLKTLLVNTHN